MYRAGLLFSRYTCGIRGVVQTRGVIMQAFPFAGCIIFRTFLYHPQLRVRSIHNCKIPEMIHATKEHRNGPRYGGKNTLLHNRMRKRAIIYDASLHILSSMTSNPVLNEPLLQKQIS